MSHRRLACVLVTLVACGSKETAPSGPLGDVQDVRAKLPPAVAAKAPADDKATKHELAVDVHGVKAQIVWRTFEEGASRWIVSYQWQVLAPSSSITLEPLGTLNPENRGTGDAVNEALIVRLRWHDNSSSSTQLGDVSYQILGDGSGKQL